MVEIHITSQDISKYIYMIVLFNAVFPQILEESGVMINVRDTDGSIQKLKYQNFISLYDHYGLNQIAE